MSLEETWRKALRSTLDWECLAYEMYAARRSGEHVDNELIKAVDLINSQIDYVREVGEDDMGWEEEPESSHNKTEEPDLFSFESVSAMAGMPLTNR